MTGERGFALFPAENFIRVFMVNKLNERIRTDSAALDFGCGEGRNTDFLVKSGYKVVGTDVSDEAITATGLRMKGHDNLRLEKITGPLDIVALPEVFSLALAWEVLHWIGEKDLWIEYMESIASKMESDGVLICTMPTEGHYLIRASEEYKEDHYLSDEDSRKACKFFAPKLDQLKAYFTEFGAQEIQTFRYEHGREAHGKDLQGTDKHEMSTDNRFSMYAFYLRF
jgi:SAM-dependent methyltransferase